MTPALFVIITPALIVIGAIVIAEIYIKRSKRNGR